MAAAAGAWLPFFLLAGVRLLEVPRVRTPPSSILLHPVGAAAALGIALRSFRAARRSSAVWRGRPL